MLPPVTPASSALSRRTVLRGAAAVGVGALAVIARPFDVAVASAPALHGIFGYGVASGDPTGDRVVIWTRATPPSHGGEPVAIPGSGFGQRLLVEWVVATDSRFRDIVRRGQIRTDPRSDHTVKVDVDGLRLALVSCSNYTGGYFGAYRGIAERDDLDLVLHVGDYIYEYGNGADRYGPASLAGVRDGIPATETIDLRDYRLRHALHKADPDLQAAHARHPWITIFDDHEVANNTWDTGAENHTPGVEGDFATRRRQAYQAYLEWMPFRLPEQEVVPHQGTRFFRRFTFGALADLSVLETRQNRSRQIDVAGFTKTGGGFIPAGVPAVDSQLADPARHLPEPEQLAWLKDGVADGSRPWHLIGNQVIVTPVRFPGQALGVPSVPELLNSDQWDGYQADQSDLIGHLQAQPWSAGDVVVLTGHIHSSWAMDLPTDRGPGGTYTAAGVELVCPSVTSDGFFEAFSAGLAGLTPEAVVTVTRGATGAIQATNPWICYLDGVGHGYTVVDVTPERVQADFYLTPTPTSAQPDPRVVQAVRPSYATSWQTLAGTRHVVAANTPLTSRADEPQCSESTLQQPGSHDTGNSVNGSLSTSRLP